MRDFLIYICKYYHYIAAIIALLIISHFVYSNKDLIKEQLNINLDYLYFENKTLVKFAIFAGIFSIIIILNSIYKFNLGFKVLCCSIYSFAFCVANYESIRMFLFEKYEDIKKRVFTQGIFTWIVCPVVFSLLPLFICFLLQTSSNAQKLNTLPKISIIGYLTYCVSLIPTIVCEEILIFTVFVVAFNLLGYSKIKNAILAVIISSAYFGMLHVFVWNLQTALTISFLHIGVGFAFLFFLDMRPLILQHLINDWYASAILTKYVLLIKPILIIGVTIPLFILLFTKPLFLIKKLQRREEFS